MSYLKLSTTLALLGITTLLDIGIKDEWSGPTGPACQYPTCNYRMGLSSDCVQMKGRETLDCQKIDEMLSPDEYAKIRADIYGLDVT